MSEPMDPKRIAAAKQLSPQQVEDLNDGWHTAIVFGLGDFDTLHMALTLDYHDQSTVALWERIRGELERQRALREMATFINGMDGATGAEGDGR